MVYTRTTYVDGAAPAISAANLNNAEAEIAQLSTAVEAGWTTNSSPTIASGGGTLTSVSGSITYKVLESILFFYITVTITTAGTGTGTVNITMPNAAVGSHAFAGRETVNTGSSIVGSITSGSTTLSTLTYNNATWIGNGSVLRMSGSYRIT